MDLLAAGDRSRPTLVGGQLGGDDLQPAVVRIATTHRRPHVAVVLQEANRRPHAPPVPQQQRSNQLCAHIAGPSGYQHPAHRNTNAFSEGIMSCTRRFASVSASSYRSVGSLSPLRRDTSWILKAAMRTPNQTSSA
jgi:hypothetical protein